MPNWTRQSFSAGIVRYSLLSFCAIAVFAVWGFAQDGPLNLKQRAPAAVPLKTPADTGRKATKVSYLHESGNAALPADPHAAVFASSDYPSASECSTCHEAIYNEWSSSSHAYASVSPVFQSVVPAAWRMRS